MFRNRRSLYSMKNSLQKDLEKYLIDKQKSHYRYVYSIVRQEADALDIVQDSILKALKKYHQLKNVDTLNAWFYRILTTSTYDFLRKNNRSGILVPDLEDMNLDPTLDKYQDIDLETAIASLTVKEQTALRFRYYEDMKFEELALVLNENISTVKTRIYTTLKKLRTMLKQDFKEGEQ